MNRYYYAIISFLLISVWSCTDIGAPCSENMDCANECEGTAIIDDCGECVGGKTGLNPNYLQDFCGVCNGDGSTCADCAGIINGNNTLDDCEVCDDDSSNDCVSYATTIQSIFNNYCGGCHIGGSSGGLNLSNYNANFNYTVVSERINLTNHNVMPPLSSESLTQTQIDLINQWINEGALDN
tara:strand:+ start:1846 stop:2391 length:546 start_codon:yes stop_codon:yes gene_type:complete